VLEPVRNTISYGQVNVLLTALVAADCLVPGGRWPRGALVGLAAAVKLTPAAFVLFFLLRRDYRAASTAALSFGVAAAAGFALAWRDSVRYWTSVVFQSGRPGNPAYAANQSLEAVLTGRAGPALARRAWHLAGRLCGGSGARLPRDAARARPGPGRLGAFAQRVRAAHGRGRQPKPPRADAG
jgi:alpha-1,2-mannosyltransferase